MPESPQDVGAPGEESPTVLAYSPGRVNLIGDHTDYNHGLALPMAVDLGTQVTFTADSSSRVSLVSSIEPEPAEVELHVAMESAVLRVTEPRWARYVAAIVASTRPKSGGRGLVETTLPVGAGLSSSAALEVALALALGFDAEPLDMARACQAAEQAATGVPSGLMDQLVVTSAVEGCALLLDFAELYARPVRIPEEAEIVVVHSGQSRTLDRSPYTARHAECEAAAYGSGPLGLLRPEDLAGIADPVLRSRARHVVNECERVSACAAALERSDLAQAGRLMTASHLSLARDFDASTPALDSLVEKLNSTRGVHGARMTGAGFGGCVVALTDAGAVDPEMFLTPAWRVTPSAGARVLTAP